MFLKKCFLIPRVMCSPCTYPLIGKLINTLGLVIRAQVQMMMVRIHPDAVPDPASLLELWCVLLVDGNHCSSITAKPGGSSRLNCLTNSIWVWI